MPGHPGQAHPGPGLQFFPQSDSGPIVIQARGGFGETLAALVAAGSETFSGTGAFSGGATQLAAVGTERFQGTGVFAAAPGSVAAVGAERFIGTGAYSGTPAQALAAGLVITPITATGAFRASAGVFAGQEVPLPPPGEFLQAIVPGYTEPEQDVPEYAGATAAALWETWMEP